jgi:hypothetical protein
VKPAGSAPDEAYQRTMLHAYLASISYIDAQAGRGLRYREAAKLDRHKLYLFTIFFSSPCRTIHRHKRHINVTRQNSASCTRNNHERIQVSNHSG